jgi:hypothetical protein
VKKCFIRVSIEAGGNAPFIVFDDADIDRAVEGGLPVRDQKSLASSWLKVPSSANSEEADKHVFAQIASMFNLTFTPSSPLVLLSVSLRSMSAMASKRECAPYINTGFY